VSGQLRVVEPGPRATVQDLGRPGLAHLGVSRSGAADRGAHALAARLLGNDPSTAAIETTLGGLVVEVTRSTWCVVTGPPVPVRLDDAEVGSHARFLAPAGSRVSLGVPASGMRNHLAVRGGLATPVVLGSRSTDAFGGIGPPPLRPGDELPVGDPAHTDHPGVDAVAARDVPDLVDLDVDPGPRRAWVDDAAWATLLRHEWTATQDSDRVGVRFDGPELTRIRTDELPSEGLVPGAVQLPASGRPIAFLADVPTTGGYPVVGVLREAALDRLAQVRPGTRVRFRRA
jgi:biotin-dependent carboxylase-like uncharacterized protein